MFCEWKFLALHFVALPFSLFITPKFFKWGLTPALALLHSREINVVGYLDTLLLNHYSSPILSASGQCKLCRDSFGFDSQIREPDLTLDVTSTNFCPFAHLPGAFYPRVIPQFVPA